VNDLVPFIAIYTTCALVTGRLLYVYLFDRDLDDGSGGTLLGLMLFWPVVAVFVALFGLAAGVLWLVTAEVPGRGKR
jgi:hypothetical protein